MRTYSPPYIIWWAIGLHLLWGTMLIVRPSIGDLAVLAGLDHVLTTGIPHQVAGAILLVAALLAAYGLLNERRFQNRTSLALLLPQYFFLLVAFFGDIQTVIVGEVAGRAVDRVILLTVLGPVVIAASLHTLAIYERHAPHWRTR